MKNYTATLDGTEITLTGEDSEFCTDNETIEVKHRYNPAHVTIEEIPPNDGAAKLLRITLNAPTHYLSSRDDTQPKSTNSISFFVAVYPGYPITPVKAYYPQNKYLASPNVFKNGDCCIAGWTAFSSTLTGTIDKLLTDAVHNPSVTCYYSPANPDMINWHKQKVASGEFPTLPLKEIYKPEEPPALPNRSERTAASKSTPPPIPQRNGNGTNTRAAVRTAPPPVPAHH